MEAVKYLELSTVRGLSEQAEIVRAEGWLVSTDRPEGEVRFREASSRRTGESC
jgi:hypothetical protein